MPVDEHIVVKEGEQYSAVFNDTRMIGEEVNISYTVTSAGRRHTRWFVDVNVELHVEPRVVEAKTLFTLHLSGGEIGRHGDPAPWPHCDVSSHVPSKKRPTVSDTCCYQPSGANTHKHSSTHNCRVSGYRFPLFFYLQVQCDASKQINTRNINPDVVSLNPKKETLSVFLLVSVLSQAVSVLGSSGATWSLWSLCAVFHSTRSPFKPLFRFSVQSCERLQCASFRCSIPKAKTSQVNVTFRVWKPTFIKVGTARQVNSREWPSKRNKWNLSHRASSSACTCRWTPAWRSTMQTCLSWTAAIGPEAWVITFIVLLDLACLHALCSLTSCMCASGKDPGFEGGLRRNPHLDHHHQHPDRTADPGTCHLCPLEGEYRTIWFSLLDEKIAICSTKASKTNLFTCYMLFYSYLFIGWQIHGSRKVPHIMLIYTYYHVLYFIYVLGVFWRILTWTKQTTKNRQTNKKKQTKELGMSIFSHFIRVLAIPHEWVLECMPNMSTDFLP